MKLQLLLQHKKYVLGALPLLLLAVVLIINSLTPQQATQQEDRQVNPTPTIFKTQITPYQQTGKAAVIYTEESLQAILDKKKNRQPMTARDALIRQNLINSLGGRSGILQRTASYRIEYIKGMDQFMVEVTALDIQRAKTDAASWLRGQGLSAAGVCNLPVLFYLNSAVTNKLEPLEVTFNPLPEGCL